MDSEKQQLFDAPQRKANVGIVRRNRLGLEASCLKSANFIVFKEEDEDGELTIIGKPIDKNESEDTLTFWQPV